MKLTSTTLSASLALLLSSGPVLAGKPHIGFSVNRYYDTDGLENTSQRLHYLGGERWMEDRAHASGLHTEAEVVNADFTGNATRFGALRASATVGKAFTPWLYAQGSVGFHNVRGKDSDFDKTVMPYNALLRVEPLKGFGITLQQGYDFTYTGAIVTRRDETDALTGDLSSVAIDWRAHERIRVQAKARYRSLNDGNDSQQYTGAILYGISPGWPWIWAGVNAERLSWDDDVEGYWTPDRFVSYGLTLEASLPVGENLEVNFGGNANRNQENDGVWGDGWSASIGADYKISDDLSIRAEAYRINSIQQSSRWVEKGIKATLIFPLH